MSLLQVYTMDKIIGKMYQRKCGMTTAQREAGDNHHQMISTPTVKSQVVMSRSQAVTMKLPKTKTRAQNSRMARRPRSPLEQILSIRQLYQLRGTGDSRSRGSSMSYMHLKMKLDRLSGSN